jgi:peptide/nickel transport system substrate-binding protein
MWTTEAYEGGFNVNKYSNPLVDQLLSEGLASTDIEERKRIYTEMQNILLSDLPSAILDFPKAIAAVDIDVRNVHPSVVDDRYNAYLWGFKP